MPEPVSTSVILTNAARALGIADRLGFVNLPSIGSIFGGGDKNIRHPKLNLPANLAGLGINVTGITGGSFRSIGKRSRKVAEGIQAAINPFIQRSQFLGLGDAPSIKALQKASSFMMGSVANPARRQAAVTAFGQAKSMVDRAMEAFGKDPRATSAFEQETGLSYDLFSQEFARQGGLRMAGVNLESTLGKARDIATPDVRGGGKGKVARNRAAQAARASWTYEGALKGRENTRAMLARGFQAPRLTGPRKTRGFQLKRAKQAWEAQITREQQLKSSGYYSLLDRAGSLKQQIGAPSLADISQLGGVFGRIAGAGATQPEPQKKGIDKKQVGRVAMKAARRFIRFPTREPRGPREFRRSSFISKGRAMGDISELEQGVDRIIPSGFTSKQPTTQSRALALSSLR